MKIKLSELRQIIREELKSKSLTEGSHADVATLPVPNFDFDTNEQDEVYLNPGTLPEFIWGDHPQQLANWLDALAKSAKQGSKKLKAKAAMKRTAPVMKAAGRI